MLSAAVYKEEPEDDTLFHSTSSLVYEHRQSIIDEALLDSIIYENIHSFENNKKPLVETQTQSEDDLEGLVTVLLHSLDSEFLDDFLITHRGFVSSDTLLRLILMYFKQSFQENNNLFKIRSFVILRTWILSYGLEDFKPSSGRLLLLEREMDEIWRVQRNMSDSDRNIMKKLEALVKDYEKQDVMDIKDEAKSDKSFSGKLRTLFLGSRTKEESEKFIDESMSTTNTTGLSESSVHKGFDISKVSAEEFSELLTSIDSQYFERLNWLELVTFPRINTDTIEESLVQRVIDHFNQLCKFLVTALLNATEERKRTKLLVKYIRTAQHLAFTQRNFNGMMAIVLALQNPAVENLAVWDQLSSKEMSGWAALLRLASPLRGFQNVREEQTRESCIPFIGLLLSDLMSLSEKTEAPIESIKFDEWRKVAAKVKEFREFQNNWNYKSNTNPHKLKNLWNQIYLQPI